MVGKESLLESRFVDVGKSTANYEEIKQAPEPAPNMAQFQKLHQQEIDMVEQDAEIKLLRVCFLSVQNSLLNISVQNKKNPNASSVFVAT